MLLLGHNDYSAVCNEISEMIETGTEKCKCENETFLA